MFSKINTEDHKITPVMIITNHKITYCNKSLVNFLGLKSSSELLDKPLWNVLAEKQPNGISARSKIQMMINNALEGNSIKFASKLKSNSFLKENVIMEFIPLAKHKTSPILVLLEEPGNNQNIFKLYKTLQKEYSILLRHIKAAVYKSDPGHSKIRFISENAKTIFGYECNNWITNEEFWKNIIHPEDVERVVNRISDMKNSRTSLKITYRVLDCTNNIKWIEHHLHWESDHNNTQYILGLYYDITLNKRIEKAVMEKEKNYKNIIESSPFYIFRLSPSGYLITANKSFLKYLGYANINQCKDLNIFTEILGFTGKEFNKFLDEDIHVTKFKQNKIEGEIACFLTGIKDEAGRLLSIDGLAGTHLEMILNN